MPVYLHQDDFNATYRGSFRPRSGSRREFRIYGIDHGRRVYVALPLPEAGLVKVSTCFGDWLVPLSEVELCEHPLIEPDRVRSAQG